MFRISFHKQSNRFQVAFPKPSLHGTRHVGFFDTYCNAAIARNLECNKLNCHTLTTYGGLEFEWRYMRRRKLPFNKSVIRELNKRRAWQGLKSIPALRKAIAMRNDTFYDPSTPLPMCETPLPPIEEVNKIKNIEVVSDLHVEEEKGRGLAILEEMSREDDD